MNCAVARSKTCFFDAGIERPIKLVEGLELAEGSGLHTPLQQAIRADQQLVLEDQLQEFEMAQAVAGRLMQAHFQALTQAGQAQLFQGVA